MQPSTGTAQASAEGTPRPSSIDRSTIHGSDENVEQKSVVVLDKEEQDVSKDEYEPHELTWPDGGLRAWLVAFGVRLLAVCLSTSQVDQSVPSV